MQPANPPGPGQQADLPGPSASGARPAPSSNTAAGPRPMTTDEIQRMLEENFNYLGMLLQYQNSGNLAEMTTYQQKLQQNLMLLAAVADSQPQPAPAAASGAPAAVGGLPPAAPAQPGAQQVRTATACCPPGTLGLNS